MVGLLFLPCRCYPFVEEDPFCLSGSSSYHVYFAGLQQQHEWSELATAAGTEAADGARAVAICIPDFSLQGEIVLLSLQTLRTKTLRFAEAQAQGP